MPAGAACLEKLYLAPLRRRRRVPDRSFRYPRLAHGMARAPHRPNARRRPAPTTSRRIHQAAGRWPQPSGATWLRFAATAKCSRSWTGSLRLTRQRVKRPAGRRKSYPRKLGKAKRANPIFQECWPMRVDFDTGFLLAHALGSNSAIGFASGRIYCGRPEWSANVSVQSMPRWR